MYQLMLLFHREAVLIIDEIQKIENWSYPEINEAFGLSVDQFIWYGSYPGPVSLMNDEDRLPVLRADSVL